MLEKGYPRCPPVRWLVLLVTAVCALPASGSESPSQYDVEIIVFRNLSGQSDGEQWPDTGSGESVASRYSRHGSAHAELSSSAWRLRRIADALQRSGAYRVLAHRAWRQTARDRHDAVPYPVSSAGDALEGTVTLVRERFLHLDVDLVLQSAYVLDETRRVRSGELHYFDHPGFGMIAEVNPYHAPAPATPADAPATDAAVSGETAGDGSGVETPVPLPGHRIRQAPY